MTPCYIVENEDPNDRNIVDGVSYVQPETARCEESQFGQLEIKASSSYETNTKGRRII